MPQKCLEFTRNIIAEKTTNYQKQANKCEKNGEVYQSSPEDLYRTREKSDAVKLC